MNKLLGLLSGFLLVGITVIYSISRKESRQDPQPRVHASIRDLMVSIIDPSADVVWGAVGTIIDEKGVHDRVPQSAKEWANARFAAIRLIEGANLLIMPGRHAAPLGAKSEGPGVELEPEQIDILLKTERAGFDGFSQALQSVSLEALVAIEHKDANSLMEIGGRMDAVCENCHRTYWYPEQHEHAFHISPFGVIDKVADGRWVDQ
jgi:hypothetical protein